jgi:hypothetical protein
MPMPDAGRTKEETDPAPRGFPTDRDTTGKSNTEIHSLQAQIADV